MTFPDASFERLQRILTLDISGCRQLTDAAFASFKGIHTLNMRDCNQATITDAAFSYLKGITSLNMKVCNQVTVTGYSLPQLLGITHLESGGCHLSTRVAARDVLNASRRARGEAENAHVDEAIVDVEAVAVVAPAAQPAQRFPLYGAYDVPSCYCGRRGSRSCGMCWQCCGGAGGCPRHTSNHSFYPRGRNHKNHFYY